MVDLDPDARPSIEQIKADPWFRGIDWDAIEREPSADRTSLRFVLSPPCDADTDMALFRRLVQRRADPAGSVDVASVLVVRQGAEAARSVRVLRDGRGNGRRVRQRGRPDGFVPRRALGLRVSSAARRRHRRVSALFRKSDLSAHELLQKLLYTISL